MSIETLKSLIDLVPDEDIDTIYKVVLKFIPEDIPLPDEIEAFEQADERIKKQGTVPFSAVNWD